MKRDNESKMPNSQNNSTSEDLPNTLQGSLIWIFSERGLLLDKNLTFWGRAQWGLTQAQEITASQRPQSSPDPTNTGRQQPYCLQGMQ